MGRERTRTGKRIHFCAAGLIFFILSGCLVSKKMVTWISMVEVSPAEIETREEPVNPVSEGFWQPQEEVGSGDSPGTTQESQGFLSQSGSEFAKERALFDLGLNYAHAENPQKDLGKALHSFRRVIQEYPQSPLAEEAKVLVGVLQENEKLNRVIEKFKQENEKLSQVIEKFKKVDIEVEEKKRENAR
jgi:TolA-binding protein